MSGRMLPDEIGDSARSRPHHRGSARIRLMPHARIAFILASNRSRPLPSTRISVLNMFPFLHDAGFTPTVIHEPSDATETPNLDDLDPVALARNYDIVFVQKCHGPSTLRLVRQLEAHGVRTIFGVCDLVEPSMVEATTASVVVTSHLRSLYPRALQERMHVVHDGIEFPERYRSGAPTRRGTRSDPLRAVLVTSGAPMGVDPIGPLPDWLRVSVVGAYPESLLRAGSLRWLVTQITRQRSAGSRLPFLDLALRRLQFVRWDPEVVYERLERADVGIIPVDARVNPAWSVKSENRLTLMMACGLPVICTPIPAYEPIVVDGENALFARSRREWLDALQSLRDPSRRAAVGARARDAVLPRYSKEAQARALVDVLHAVLDQGDRAHDR